MTQPYSKDPGDPSNMTQEQLLKFGEGILNHHKHKHPPGSPEREAYEGSLGMLAMFPQQPWWKRKWGAWRKRLAEKRMRKTDPKRTNLRKVD